MKEKPISKEQLVGFKYRRDLAGRRALIFIEIFDLNKRSLGSRETSP